MILKRLKCFTPWAHEQGDQGSDYAMCASFITSLEYISSSLPLKTSRLIEKWREGDGVTCPELSMGAQSDWKENLKEGRCVTTSLLHTEYFPFLFLLLGVTWGIEKISQSWNFYYDELVPSRTKLRLWNGRDREGMSKFQDLITYPHVFRKKKSEELTHAWKVKLAKN